MLFHKKYRKSRDKSFEEKIMGEKVVVFGVKQ